MIDTEKVKTAMLCFEAKRWIGVMEEGQNNGQIIRMFQHAVDDKADGEAWCMAFAQFCIKITEQASLELFPQHPSQISSIFRSEHCMTTWNRSPHLQTREPAKGSLCIWQKFNGRKATASGHTGIITEVHSDGSLSLVEANTSNSSDDSLIREGDGVYVRRYAVGQLNRGSLFLKGFLKVWQ